MLRITRFVWELSNRWHNTQLKTHPCSAHHLAGHPILMCCLWACFNILWHFPCNAFGFGCATIIICNTFRPPQHVRCYKLSDWPKFYFGSMWWALILHTPFPVPFVLCRDSFGWKSLHALMCLSPFESGIPV